MPLNTKILEAMAIAGLDGMMALADQNSTIEIRSGAQPAHPGLPDAGSLLLVFTLDDLAPYDGATAGAPPSDAVSLAAGLPKSTTGLATDTAGHGRLKNAAGTALADGSVGITPGQSDFVLSSLAIQTGVTYDLTASSFTMPVSA